jgi:hypothetical protein
MITKEIDFGKLEWENVSLHNGVAVALVDDEQPLVTTHAIRIDGKSEVGLHYHDRKNGWVETIYFVRGGNFEILDSAKGKEYNTKNLVYLKVKAKEKYGIKNLSDEPLFFLASMRPSFKGFGEIVNCKEI